MYDPSHTVAHVVIDHIRPVDIALSEDVEAFFRALVDAGYNFHPEESFFGMVDCNDGTRSFSDADAARLDACMEQCYVVMNDLRRYDRNPDNWRVNPLDPQNGPAVYVGNYDPCAVGVKVMQERFGA